MELNAIAHLPETAKQALDAMPVWMDFAAGLVGVWGVLMWLFGRKLLKASFTVTGLVIGAVAGAMIFREQNPQLQARWVYWAVAGGLIGAVAFYLLMRLWMAVTLAAIFGLIAPVAFAALQGTADDNAAQLSSAIGHTFHESVAAAGAQTGGPAPTDQRAETQSTASGSQTDALRGRFNDLRDRFVETVRQWWQAMDSASRWVMSALALMGAVIGLVVGLVMPNLAGGLVTAMVGSALVLAMASHLSGQYLPAVAKHLPDTTTNVLITLGIATIIGTVFQWIILRHSADNG